jgi:hypothetical protein
MIRYYQLTPEILLEYVYEGDPKLNEDGIKGNTKDIFDEQTSTMLLKSDMFNTKYLCFKNESSGFGSLPNLVLPLNNTESQFVVAKREYQNFYSKLNASNIFSSKKGSGYIYEDTNYDENIRVNGDSDSDNDSNRSCDVKYDKCIVHFTSRNFFGNYDSLIFQAYAYMKNKAKLYLASFLFTKTDFRELKADHLLYNEKLYTTQIEFDIPSVFAIFSEKIKKNDDEYPFVADTALFVEALESQNIELLENTPIGINVYGVTGSIKGMDDYVRLKTLKINSISIPYIYNRLDEIHVNIYEASDGDYYCIEPKMSSDYSFVDYIESMGEDIHSYMVMHELYLRESWVNTDGTSHSKITHKECHIITINADDDEEEIIDAFNETIMYRPICIQGGSNCSATIIDTIKIINTVDSSSYEVTGSLDIANPYKYGKKIKSINLNGGDGTQIRPIVNVYNKKGSNEKGAGINGINLNRGGGFVIENLSQNITSFIECTNIGVSILEISPEDIN